MIHKVRKSTPTFTSLVLIRLVLTEIQRFKTSKLTKKFMAFGRCLGQRPDGHAFSIDCILLTFESICTKLGDFVKLGLHFMTM